MFTNIQKIQKLTTDQDNKRNSYFNACSRHRRHGCILTWYIFWKKGHFVCFPLPYTDRVWISSLQFTICNCILIISKWSFILFSLPIWPKKVIFEIFCCNDFYLNIVPYHAAKFEKKQPYSRSWDMSLEVTIK